VLQSVIFLVWNIYIYFSMVTDMLQLNALCTDVKYVSHTAGLRMSHAAASKYTVCSTRY